MYTRKYIIDPILWVLMSLLLFGAGCQKAITQIPVDHFSEVDQYLLPDVIKMSSDSLDPLYRGLRKPNVVYDSYKRRNYFPVWTIQQSLSPAGDSLIDFIENVHYYGLFPKTYHVREIWRMTEKGPANGWDHAARLDVLLTDAFLSIAADLRFGANDHPPGTDSLGVNLLQQLHAGEPLIALLESQEPEFAGYVSLKRTLKLILDSLTETTPALQQSLYRESFDTLNVIRRIAINLNRWRAEHIPWSDDYVFINIPSFMLYVVSNDSVVLQSRVIVGTPETPTPDITSKIECLVTYPYWHVPRKIATEEYLPIIQEDVSFLSRNNFDVLDRRGNVLNADSVAWDKFHKEYFPVVLRQREGMENALGVIKFVFDNPYAIFLHDTNARRLFRSDTRAFSHGCIRMEKAVELAHFLVTRNVMERSSFVDSFLKQEIKHTINLKRPMPIYIRYFTAEGCGKSLKEYPDLYEKDEGVFRSMPGRFTH